MFPRQGSTSSPSQKVFAQAGSPFCPHLTFTELGTYSWPMPEPLPALVSKQAEAEPAKGRHPRYPPLSHPTPTPFLSLCAAPLFSPHCQRMPWGICEFPFYKMNDKSISSHLRFCSLKGFNPNSLLSQSRGRDEPIPSGAPKPPP